MKKVVLAGIGIFLFITALTSYLQSFPPVKDTMTDIECIGKGVCFMGEVGEIIDGDTLYVNGKSIRLALVNSPEMDNMDGIRAKEFTASVCPSGSRAIVDEDGGQLEGSFGRMIAAVYCNEVLLNSALLESGHAMLDQRFCSVSEFASEDWAKKFGC